MRGEQLDLVWTLKGGFHKRRGLDHELVMIMF
jgi:hypothetical protein